MTDDLVKALREPGDEVFSTRKKLMLADRIEQLEKELETERLRLAACGTAALGYFNGCADEYRSASLDDVLRLQEQLAAVTKAANYHEFYCGASQAREAKLREALEPFVTIGSGFDMEDVMRGREALSLPHDDTALRQYVARELRAMADDVDTDDWPTYLHAYANELDGGKK